MEIMLFELALTFYFAATIVCVMELFKGSKTTSKVMLSLVVIGFALHTANIIARYVLQDIFR